MKEAESFLGRLHGKKVCGDVEDINSRSNTFTMLWSWAALLCFPQVAFGTCGCSLRLASLLGKLLGTKL